MDLTRKIDPIGMGIISRFCLADFKFLKVNAFLSSYRLHNLSITQSGSLNDLHNDHQQKMQYVFGSRSENMGFYLYLFV